MLMLATTAAMIEQFNKNNILILEEMGYEVHVIGNWKAGNPISDERLEQFKIWLEEHNGKWFHMDSTRKPHDLKNNISAYKKVISLIKEYRYDFIHCHTPIGSVIARLAAHKTNTPVIYTAHGFHFYEGAPIINWLLYYPVEKLLSYWTDILITINTEDYNRAKRKFHAKRIEYVPGVGIDVKKYAGTLQNREEKRAELGLSSDDKMLLSVGELNRNKNHEVVIRAIEKLESNIHYFIAGQGPLKEYLAQLAKELDVEDRVHLLGFSDNVVELYQCADVYVLPSKREGLNLSIMEAMAAGLPVICNSIRGNTDLIMEAKGGILQHKGCVEEYVGAINNLTDGGNIILTMGSNNFDRIKQFSVDVIDRNMRDLYEKG